MHLPWESNPRRKSSVFGTSDKNHKKNQLYTEFGMEVFEWKENSKSVFRRRQNIEEGKNKLYSLFNDQFKTFLKTKLRWTKGYNKIHNILAK